MKEIIDAEREQKKNEPFPSFMNGIDIVMQRAYDSVIEYQEKNGVILDDRAAEKMFWEHMAGLS